MSIRTDGFPARLLVAVLVLVGSVAVSLGAARGGPPSKNAPAAPAAAQATGFVGDDTCATCHDGEAKGLHQTLHGKAQNGRTPAAKTGQTCETCHGPGQNHVDSGKKED